MSEDDRGLDRRALVLAAGDLDPAPGPENRSFDIVIAADGGLAHAVRLGLRPDLVVGDLDSADPAQVAAARADGAAVERHPADKAATDLELALDAAMARGATSITVVGVGGGRPDHHVANLLLLTHTKYAAIAVEAHWGPSRLVPVHGRRTVSTDIDSLVTLLAVGAPATDVHTSGLRWALAGDTLTPGSSRGVSNLAVDRDVTVAVGSGTLLAIITAERA